MRPIYNETDVDAPWNKLRERGAEALRDHELLALILRTSSREDSILKVCNKILNQCAIHTLLNTPKAELIKINGISPEKADTLIAGFELSKRALNQGLGIAPYITSPADGVGMLTDIKDKKKEYFVALFLNGRNQLICRENVSIGSLNASLVHPREVFAPAIGSAAASVVLAHNHPSGDVTPSQEDIQLTRRMSQAGQIMGIEVLDHWIITSKKYLSMKEAHLF